MGIERIGRGFIQVEDEDGNRAIFRIASIQQMVDADEFQQETFLVVAGRTFLVRASLDDLKATIAEEPFQR